MRARWLIAISVGVTLLLYFAGFSSSLAAEMQPAVRPYSYALFQEEVEHVLTKGVFLLKGLVGPPPVVPEKRTAAVERFFSPEQGFDSRETSSRGSRVGLQQPAEQSFRDEVGSLTSEEMRQLVENTVEGQVSSVLTEQGLTFSLPLIGIRFPFPPVRFTLEKPPNLLITSPRDRIKLQKTWLLRSDLTPEEMSSIEKQTESAGVSAIVEPLGGLATYPSIVRRGDALRATITSVAHEWVHHYLFFYPLGRRYGSSYEMTTLNEMVATMAGKEIGEATYQRYYAQADKSAPTVKKPVFDFNQEMKRTRKTVDEYLAQGEVSKAEAYMEEQRQFLASRGYNIRKLNQAYFAFHSTYADSPAAVGPTQDYLRDIRKRSRSLADFLRTVAQIGSPSDIADLAAQKAQP